MSNDLAALKNIGPTISKRLNEIGVHTRADLARVGPVEAYEQIRRNHANVSVCYYLYSLQGALMDVHWDDLPEPLKDDLYTQVRGPKGRRR